MEEDCAFARLRITDGWSTRVHRCWDSHCARLTSFLIPYAMQDVQRKFAYEIVATSNCPLRQNAVCAALPNVVLPGGCSEVRSACRRLHARRFDGQFDSRTSVEIRSHSVGDFGELKEVHA